MVIGETTNELSSKYQLKVYLEQWNLSYLTQEYSEILNNS
jgi:hypothetical protein